ncbi:hypothetical protein [Rhodocaloribacter sp.]
MTARHRIRLIGAHAGVALLAHTQVFSDEGRAVFCDVFGGDLFVRHPETPRAALPRGYLSILLKFRFLYFIRKTLTLLANGAIYYLVRRRQFLRAFQGFPKETGLTGRAAPRLQGSGDALWLHR